MRTLILTCNERLLQIKDNTSEPHIYSGADMYDAIKIEFDSEWDNYENKGATFYVDDENYYVADLCSGNIVEIPYSVLKRPQIIYFGVFGISESNRITTSAFKIIVKQGTMIFNENAESETINISDLLSRVLDVERRVAGKLIDIQSELDKAVGRLADDGRIITGATQEQIQRIESLETAVETIQSDEPNHIKRIKNLEDSVDALQSDELGHVERIESLEQEQISNVKLNDHLLEKTNNTVNINAITDVKLNDNLLSKNNGSVNINAITEISLNGSGLPISSGSVSLDKLIAYQPFELYITFENSPLGFGSTDVSKDGYTPIGIISLIGFNNVYTIPTEYHIVDGEARVYARRGGNEVYNGSVKIAVRVLYVLDGLV